MINILQGSIALDHALRVVRGARFDFSAQYAFDTSQAMATDEIISDEAPHWQSLILQWTRPFGGKRVSSPILLTHLPNWTTRLPTGVGRTFLKAGYFLHWMRPSFT
jgi:hypothetical protein